jgi:hypothetical protein
MLSISIQSISDEIENLLEHEQLLLVNMIKTITYIRKVSI